MLIVRLALVSQAEANEHRLTPAFLSLERSRALYQNLEVGVTLSLDGHAVMYAHRPHAVGIARCVESSPRDGSNIAPLRLEVANNEVPAVADAVATLHDVNQDVARASLICYCIFVHQYPFDMFVSVRQIRHSNNQSAVLLLGGGVPYSF